MTELRSAIRTLRSTPVVSLVVILSLAFGIGANTAIFSLIDSLLLRTLPVERPDRLVSVEPEDRYATWSHPAWKEIRARRHELFETAVAVHATRYNLSPRGQTDFVNAIMASGNYFEALGVPAMLGRAFTERDDEYGGGPDGPVVVISHAFWQRRFGGAADVLGRTLAIERVPFTIVGVTPPGFFGTEVGGTFDVAVPIGTDTLISGKDTALDRHGVSWLRVLARLEEGQTLAEAEQSFRGVQPQIREATRDPAANPAFRHEHLRRPFQLTPAALGTSSTRAAYRTPILAMMAVVGLVLLIACANVANLFLARAAARRHELSVRLALGASGWRLARLLLAEVLLLSAVGALAGLAMALWTSRVLVRQLSTERDTLFLDVQLDWRVLAFTAAIGVAAALLAGLAPAWRASRTEPMDAIRGHGRGVTVKRRFDVASLLVIGQIALSLVLVVGAGLFIRTFVSLVTLDLGFDRDPVLVVDVDAQGSASEPSQRGALFERVVEAARGVPGVAQSALSDITPVSGSVTDFGVDVEQGPPLAFPHNVSFVNALSPGWFATYGTRITEGRDFDGRDRADAPRVAIVNQTFARTLLQGRPAIGRRFRSAFPRPGQPNPWMEVVGVVEDATYRRLRDDRPPTFYVPVAQWVAARTGQIPASMRLSIRAAGGSPALLARGVAEAVARVDPALAMTFTPLARQVDDSLARERILAMISGYFGGLALLLAGLGLYGVMSYSVGRRRHEIGIRMALGAVATDVVRLVLGRAFLLVGAGVATGAIASLWASRFVETLLYGVTRYDPTTLIVAAFVLATVGAAASWIPARRASRIDPARVLQAE